MRTIIGLIFILAFSTAAFGQRGKPAENFSAVAMDGQTIELSSLKGKVVVLTFWSSRCGICHVEIPKLNRLAEQYKNKNVVFLALTMENPTRVQAFLKNNRFDFQILPNSFGVVMQYAEKDGEGNVMMGFPTHFLINQMGEIELAAAGFDKSDDLDLQINRLLSVK